MVRPCPSCFHGSLDTWRPGVETNRETICREEASLCTFLSVITLPFARFKKKNKLRAATEGCTKSPRRLRVLEPGGHRLIVQQGLQMTSWRLCTTINSLTLSLLPPWLPIRSHNKCGISQNHFLREEKSLVKSRGLLWAQHGHTLMWSWGGLPGSNTYSWEVGILGNSPWRLEPKPQNPGMVWVLWLIEMFE